jgi:hypothetical protein
MIECAPPHRAFQPRQIDMVYMVIYMWGISVGRPNYTPTNDFNNILQKGSFMSWVGRRERSHVRARARIGYILEPPNTTFDNSVSII